MSSQSKTSENWPFSLFVYFLFVDNIYVAIFLPLSSIQNCIRLTNFSLTADDMPRLMLSGTYRNPLRFFLPAKPKDIFILKIEPIVDLTLIWVFHWFFHDSPKMHNKIKYGNGKKSTNFLIHFRCHFWRLKSSIFHGWIMIFGIMQSPKLFYLCKNGWNYRKTIKFNWKMNYSHRMKTASKI